MLQLFASPVLSLPTMPLLMQTELTTIGKGCVIGDR